MPVRPAAPKSGPGPVLARVGAAKLHLSDVEPLAGLAAEIRLEMGLEVPQTLSFEEKVNLAAEFLVLLHWDEIGDEKKRLLARRYLDWMFQSTQLEPVSDVDLKKAHQGEIKKYLTTGESDLYRPTVLSAAAIVVGCFPDLHPPDQDEDPVLTMEQARELADEIAAACGGERLRSVPSLDEFLYTGRRFQAGHPSVVIREFDRVFEDPRLARLPQELHRAITMLPGNGAVSSPVEVPGAVYVIRRGVSFPGKGERPEEIGDELHKRVRLSQKRSVFMARMNELKEYYRARTWPERLRELEQ